MSRRDDELLIQGVFDRDVTETDFEQLEARLRDEPELRQLYYDYARLHHVLTEEFEGRAHLEERLRSLRDAPPKKATVVQSVLAAAAILMLLAIAAFFIVVRPNQGATVVSYGPESSAAIVHPDGKTRDGQLRKGSRLVLKRGAVQLKLPSGVLALVEGPATVEGGGRNSLRLEFGRAWFQVPKGAQGFTCNTPGLEIEDLGTEFGVIAVPGKPEEVHVFKGRVRVHPHGRPGEFREMSAGEALAWSDDYYQLPGDGPGFVTSLPRSHVVFSDDFSEPDDTRLRGKYPDTGAGPWLVTEGNPLVLDETLDSTGVPHKAFAPIDTSRLDEVNHIFLLTIDTGVPDSRAFHSAGWAGVSLFANSEEQIFAGDSFGHGNCWSFDPPGARDDIVPTNPPLRGKQVVTLRYDFRSGLIEMFQGHDSRGRALASTIIDPGIRFDQIRIGNGEGGDLALRLLRASVLVSDPSR